MKFKNTFLLLIVLVAHACLADGGWINPNDITPLYLAPGQMCADYPAEATVCKGTPQPYLYASERGKGLFFGADQWWDQSSTIRNTDFRIDEHNSVYQYIVCVTETGKKYHRPGCSYLYHSSEPMPLSQARLLGYTPCSRCKP